MYHKLPRLLHEIFVQWTCEHVGNDLVGPEWVGLGGCEWGPCFFV